MRSLGELLTSAVMIAGAIVAVQFIIRGHWPKTLKLASGLVTVLVCLASLLFKGAYKRGIDDVVGEMMVDWICHRIVFEQCPQQLPPNPPGNTNRPLPTPLSPPPVIPGPKLQNEEIVGWSYYEVGIDGGLTRDGRLEVVAGNSNLPDF